MNKILNLLLPSIVVFNFVVSEAKAEELQDIFKKVNEYVTAQNYPKAIEELAWAKKEIEKMHSVKLQAFLPEVLAGLKGDAFNAQSALGINTIERSYKGEGKSLTLTLTGSSGSGEANPFGGLAALAKMGQMMGATQPGNESFRIDGKTATLTTNQGSESELSIFLDSGSMLVLKSSDTELLKKAGNELKVTDIDKYLRGM